MLGIRTSRIRVVSGGGSAAAGLECQPSSPAVPAIVIPRRNLRRLTHRGYRVCIGTSLPNACQCCTENAAPLPPPNAGRHGVGGQEMAAILNILHRNASSLPCCKGDCGGNRVSEVPAEVDGLVSARAATDCRRAQS